MNKLLENAEIMFKEPPLIAKPIHSNKTTLRGGFLSSVKKT
jgi:hypothetical protein